MHAPQLRTIASTTLICFFTLSALAQIQGNVKLQETSESLPASTNDQRMAATLPDGRLIDIGPGKKGLELHLFDASLKLKKTTSISGHKINNIPAKLEFIEVIDGSPNLFFSTFDKRMGQAELFSQRIDPKNLKISDATPSWLVLPCNNAAGYSFKYSKSGDSKNVLVVGHARMLYDKAEGDVHYGGTFAAKSYNDRGSLLYDYMTKYGNEQPGNPEESGFRAGIQDALMLNNGNAYFTTWAYSAATLREEGFVHSMPNEKQGWKAALHSDQSVQCRGQLTEGTDGRAVLAGIRTNQTGSSLTPERFYARLSPGKPPIAVRAQPLNSLKLQSPAPLSEEPIIRKGMASSADGNTFLVPRQHLTLSTNQTLLVCDRVEGSGSTDAQQRGTYVFGLTNRGDLLWTQVIPKHQWGAFGDLGTSQHCFVGSDDNLVLIYPTHKDNPVRIKTPATQAMANTTANSVVVGSILEIIKGGRVGVRQVFWENDGRSLYAARCAPGSDASVFLFVADSPDSGHWVRFAH